jgi:16S rRNA (cytidine1402-2'-O)-methyltransferase
MKSFHKFNEHKQIDNIINLLKAGKTIALISDAGTPGISDPGFILVREAVREGIEVETLPGATALIPALVNSGLPSERFVFEGFLPVKKGRQKRLKSLAEETRTMIFYESPHRLVKTLRQLAGYLGDERQASVSRELTKKFEETRRGTLAELAAYYETTPPKGEIVIVVSGKK